MEDVIIDKEAYENYVELKKIGIKLIDGGLDEGKHFVGLAHKNRYELDEKVKDKKIKLVPYYHSKRVMQVEGDIASPKMVVFEKYKILTQTAADALYSNLEMLIGNVFNNKSSYIELYKTPVECELYDVFQFLVGGYNKFKVLVKEGDQVHIIPRLSVSPSVTVESLAKESQGLSEEQKDVVASNLEFLER